MPLQHRAQHGGARALQGIPEHSSEGTAPEDASGCCTSGCICQPWTCTPGSPDHAQVCMVVAPKWAWKLLWTTLVQGPMQHLWDEDFPALGMPWGQLPPASNVSPPPLTLIASSCFMCCNLAGPYPTTRPLWQWSCCLCCPLTPCHACHGPTTHSWRPRLHGRQWAQVRRVCPADGMGSMGGTLQGKGGLLDNSTRRPSVAHKCVRLLAMHAQAARCLEMTRC